jgi:hypothetical protein
MAKKVGEHSFNKIEIKSHSLLECQEPESISYSQLSEVIVIPLFVLPKVPPIGIETNRIVIKS